MDTLFQGDFKRSVFEAWSELQAGLFLFLTDGARRANLCSSHFLWLFLEVFFLQLTCHAVQSHQGIKIPQPLGMGLRRCLQKLFLRPLRLKNVLRTQT